MMWPARRILKYTLITGGAIGTISSLRANRYDVDSIGIVRFSRAAKSVLGVAALYKIQLYSKNLDPSSEEFRELQSKVHQEGAERLLKLCCMNRGVYIKVGQHVGALDYILPPEYVNTMKVLHSRAPTSSMSELYQVIREDLKQNPEDIFASFDEQPLGTASLAQVHKATLKDGTTVAVKIQHPHVRKNSTVDMKTMEILVKLMSWAFPEFKMDWLVAETKKNIPVELDFFHEGENAEKVRDLYKDLTWLRIPSIFWDQSSERVLTMEYLPGGQVNDLEYIQQHNIDPVEVSKKLGLLFSNMIFVHGFVHSDPHPGNILVHTSPKGELEIMLLDHGLYADLSNEFRCEYSKLWLCILNKNVEGIKVHCTNLGVGDLSILFTCMVTGRMWSSISTGIQTTKFSRDEQGEFQKVLPTLLPQISTVLENVNRQMLLILKTNDLMRGIERTLRTESRMASFLVMSHCCIKSVYSERLKMCHTYFSYLRTSISERWELFKISLYYTYLNIQTAFDKKVASYHQEYIA